MQTTVLDRSVGRQAFGANPAAYHAARPAYPAWVFEALRKRCGLKPDTPTFEIGAGTGIATRELLNLAANPLVAIEPDVRLARFLQETIVDKALTIEECLFENVELCESSFGLGFSATSFHWLNEEAALAKVARLLTPGGWWATVWNVFGNPNLPDPFHEATKTLLSGPSSPAEGDGHLPFPLDTKERIAALERTAAFDVVEHFTQEWPLVLTTAETVALYATYSNINARPDREEVLTELGRIASTKFNGHVIRNIVTVLYIARRRV